MKFIKWAAAISLVGAAAFVVGFLRNMSYNSGSLITRTNSNFYIFSIFPYDATYEDDLEDLGDALEMMFEETMTDIEIDELNSMYYDND